MCECFELCFCVFVCLCLEPYVPVYVSVCTRVCLCDLLLRVLRTHSLGSCM